MFMTKQVVKQNAFPLLSSPIVNRGGFTLVELLVVVSLVGILAGVMISIINPVKQRKIAEDGVKMANLQKYALGIEAYGNANGAYPAAISLDSNNVPTSPADLVNFVSRVPNGEPAGATYLYYPTGSDNFAVVVTKSEDTVYCFKYRSAWGKIRTCPVSTSCGSEASVTDCI